MVVVVPFLNKFFKINIFLLGLTQTLDTLLKIWITLSSRKSSFQKQIKGHFDSIYINLLEFEKFFSIYLATIVTITLLSDSIVWKFWDDAFSSLLLLGEHRKVVGYYFYDMERNCYQTMDVSQVWWNKELVVGTLGGNLHRTS